MKPLTALRSGLILLLAVISADIPAVAQFGGSGALGGPSLSRGVSRPLGGIQNTPLPGAGRRNGIPPSRHGGGGRGNVYLPYAYSVYVPNYFDYAVDPSYAPMVAPQAVPPSGFPPQAYPQQPSPQQPVIINQYFGQADPNSPANGNSRTEPAEPQAQQDASAPGDPLAPAENYYLIAYKNRAVYAALAYWVEGTTLHYVTTQNTHNQAALDLIDVELTKNLNQARNVPFTLTGR